MSQCCICRSWLGYSDLMGGKCSVSNSITKATDECPDFLSIKLPKYCTGCGTKLEERDYGLPASTVFLWCVTCKKEKP